MCGIEKPDSEYYEDRTKGGRRSNCKSCTRARVTLHRANPKVNYIELSEPMAVWATKAL